MKLHELNLLEAEVSPYKFTEIKSKAITTLLKKHCSQAIDAAKRGFQIYRGTGHKRDAGIYDPGAGIRKSEDNTNYYTIILDTNPLNEEFPKRSNSFIASTDFQKARTFGNVNQVFPFDDTDIGIIKEGDIWQTELKFIPLNFNIRINKFNIFWDRVLKSKEYKSMDEMLGVLKNSLNDENAIDKIILELDKVGFRHPNPNWYYGNSDSEITSENIKIIKKFIEIIPKVYSYKRLGIKKKKINDIGPNLGGSEGAELWFSGKCIMIPIEQVEKLIL